MNRGTVIYMGGFALPDKNAAANRVVSNGKLFETLGYKTVFLGTDYFGEHFDGVRQLSERENMFQEAHPVSSKEWAKRLFSIDNLNKVVANYSDVRMIILYNLPFVTLMRVKKAFSKSDIKIVYDCTEWTKDTDGSFLKKAFKFVDEFFVRKFIHKASDGIIAISRMMEKAYKSNPRFLLLPPLVDINDAIWHQKPEKEEGIFEFCFAGVPDGKKESLDKVVEAFCILNKENTRLRIVGISQEDFKKLYPNTPIPQDFKDKILFMGKRSHSEAVKYILSCGCYIFIRQSDRRNNAGFPTKFAESYTCSVPVITTDVSDVGEYIKSSGRGCVLSTVSAEEIARAMNSQIKSVHEEAFVPDSTFHYESYKDACSIWFNKF